jgi:2-methylcitrate dehydratase
MINFSRRVHFEDIAPETIDQLKKHVLDSVGSLIFSLRQDVPKKLMRQVAKMQEETDIIPIHRLTMDRVAELYTALIRYPDFMDNFLAKHATCHPSDNLGVLLAAGRHKKINGQQFLKAMAIAYQLICRLTEKFPVMSKGFDHTVLLNFSATIAVSEILGLSKEETRHACGMVGCTVNPLVTLRASYTSEWKGFASSCTAFNCINKAYLAAEGMTGPYSIFEGPMAMNKVMEMELEHNWNHEEEFELIPRCMLKSYNSEVHSQSLIEGMLELAQQHNINAQSVKEIQATTFLTAYHIIGGGEYGDRKVVVNKEQADHSLPYLLAVALLDKQVYPEQFAIDRINSPDVQELLKKVEVTTSFPLKEPRKIVGKLDSYTEVYPDKMKGKILVKTTDNKKFEIEKEDYAGFFTRPLEWQQVQEKFTRLTNGIITGAEQQRMISTVMDLENKKLNDLTELFETVEINN